MNHFLYTGLRLLLISAALAALMLGCARREQVDAPDFNPSYEYPQNTDNQSLYRKRIRSMSRTERKVFERTGELDKKLDPWMEQEVARLFLRYSREKRSTIQAFMRNSTPYLANAKNVFRRHGLPEDLAYLAFLESGYNPLAVSRSNAVGMWQFISSTGRNFGLRQDWWMDERMDPQKSTEAAAAYLSKLYDIFHDWHLAIASYNAGEGKIGRAKDAASARKLEEIIRKNDQLSYSLRLREETRLYVPRFLAIMKVVRGAEELGLKPAPHDEKHPALMPSVTLSVKPSTDLVELSRRMGMTWREFLAYNPQFLRSISPTNRAVNVHIPRSRESQARRLLAGTLSGSGWTYYTVRRKDSKARISKVTGVPPSVISEVNPGSLYSGRRIRLPSRAGSVQPYRPFDPSRETRVAAAEDDGDASITAALLELEQDILQRKRPAARERGVAAPSGKQGRRLPATHKVRSGEYVIGIAGKYGITPEELYAANGGKAKLKDLHPGQVIKLPSAGQPAAKKDQAAPQDRRAQRTAAASIPAVHKVQPGESLIGISRKYDIPLDSLYAANGGREKLKNLQAGQTLRLPQAAPAQASRAASNPAPQKPQAEQAKKMPAQTAAAMPAVHKVQPGESLTGISRKYNIPLDSLYAANGGREKLKNLQAGQTLRLPQAAPAQASRTAKQPAAAKKQASPAPAAASAPTARSQVAAGTGTHVVKPGETLWSIARAYNMPPGELLKMNGLSADTKVRAGEKIKVRRH